MTPTISYVVTSYGQAMFHRQIAATLAQGALDDVEIIVVDDKPDANETEKLVRIWGALRASRVRVLRHDVNAGVSAARNTGIRAATAPWLCFIDGDDLVSPHHPRVMQERATQNPDASMLGCARLRWPTAYPVPRAIFDALLNEGESAGGREFDGQRLNWSIHEAPKVSSKGMPTFPAIHGSLFARDRCGLFSDLFCRILGVGGEDIDFCLGTISRGRYVRVPRVLSVLRRPPEHAGSHYVPNQKVEFFLITARNPSFYTADELAGFSAAGVAARDGLRAAATLRQVRAGEIDEFPIAAFTLALDSGAA